MAIERPTNFPPTLIAKDKRASDAKAMKTLVISDESIALISSGPEFPSVWTCFMTTFFPISAPYLSPGGTTGAGTPLAPPATRTFASIW